MSTMLEAPESAEAEVDSTSAAVPVVTALPLGEQLVGASLLTAEQLDNALSQQNTKGRRLGETLVELGLITEDQLLPYIERQLGVAAIRLREGILDPDVAQLLPQEVSERLAALALFKVRDTLCVAMAEPQNLQHTDEIERLTHCIVRPVFTFRSSIERLTKRCYSSDFSVDEVTADMDENAVELQADAAEFDITTIEGLVDGSPIINLVNYLMMQSIRQGASDVHIEPSRKYTYVRFRVDGQLREVLRPRKDIHPAIVSRIKVMGKMDIAEHRVPQDGRCQIAVEGKEVDLRISTLPTVLGEKVVLRILDRGRLTFNLDELGIPRDLLTDVKRLLAKPYGLLLVTGPTGSGKTTTLYSALELIKSVHTNIVTVEDPVEYQLELINQVLVDEDRGLDFATALRSILRQDPDIIMVGEIRDGKTANMAVQAALTGHLVLSTLHTNDSAGAIVRLLDMGLDPFKISAALVGVIAQRLVRTICSNCRESYYPSAELLDTLHYEGDRRRTFARGAGCSECFDTGCKGRIGVYEVLNIDPVARELISEGASLDKLRLHHKSKGGTNLVDQGIRMCEREIVSLEEIARVTLFE